MDPDRVQELSKLLHMAVEDVVVEWRLRRDNPGPIGVRWYRAALRELRTAYSNDLLHTKELYEPRIQDKSVAKKLLEFIRSEVAEYIRWDDGNRFTILGPSGDVVGDELLTNLLSIAIIDGVDKAAAEFGRCVSLNRVPAQRISLLGGINITEGFHINDEMRIIPIGNRVRDIPRFVYENFFSYDHTLFLDSTLKPNYFLGRAVLMVDFIYAPVFHSQLHGWKIDTVTQNIELAEARIAEFLEVLSSVCGVNIGGVLRWTYLDNDSIFCQTGKAVEFDLKSDIMPRAEVSPAQLNRAAEMYEKSKCESF